MFFFHIFAIGMLHPKIKPTTTKTYVRIDAAASKSATLKALKSRELKSGVFRLTIFALDPEGRILGVFYVHPHLGRISILANIFETGWAHQLVFVEEMMNSTVFAREAF